MPRSSYSLSASIELTDIQVNLVSEKTRKYINARCKDLMEVNKVETKTGPGSGVRNRAILDYRVDFIHRTVRDFLMTSDMHKMLQSRVPKKFDARISLCKVMLALVKVMVPHCNEKYKYIEYDPLIYEMLYHAREVEIHDGVSEVALLDELHWVLIAHRDANRGHEACITGFMWQYRVEKFVAIVVKAGLHKYVAQKLDILPQYLRQVYYWPLLAFAVESPMNPAVTESGIPSPNYGNAQVVLDADMARILLDRGADPNEKFLGRVKNGVDPQYCTVWEAFLFHCYKRRTDYGTPKQLFEAADRFIRHGADPELSCEKHITGQKSAFDILKMVLRPSQYEQITALMTEKQHAKQDNCAVNRRKDSRVKRSPRRLVM